MAQDARFYNIAVIRKLLLAAFTAEELRRFCQDHAVFRPVLSDFGSNLVLNQMVDSLVSYCATHSLFDNLLAEIKRVNPRQYAHFEEHLRSVGKEGADLQPQVRGRRIQVGEIRAPGCSARNVVILLSLTLLMIFALAVVSLVSLRGPAAPARIDHIYVDSDNNLHVVIEGTCQPYRLYVRQIGQTFGDPPYHEYYRIYENGSCAQDLLVVVDVDPDTVYCAEIKSEDDLTTYHLTSYRTDEGDKPFVGEIYQDNNCPFE